MELRESQKKEDTSAPNVREVAKCCVFSMIRASAESKSRMFGPLFEVEMLKMRTPLWREAHFEVKMYKTLHVRTTF